MFNWLLQKACLLMCDVEMRRNTFEDRLCFYLGFYELIIIIENTRLKYCARNMNKTYKVPQSNVILKLIYVRIFLRICM